MNKNKFKAFTLIELLVVSTIIILISGSWVLYFSDFTEKQTISQKIEFIKNDLNALDEQVKSYKIYDYEFELNSWSWKYIVNKNIFDSKYKQIINFSNNSFTWTIKKVIHGTWIFKIYKNIKLSQIKILTWPNDFSYNFNEKQKYKIIATQSWEFLNEININYFSEENLYPKKENSLYLIKIYTWSLGDDLKNIKIKNIWWKKQFFYNSTLINYDINLLFENKGKQQVLKLKKLYE